MDRRACLRSLLGLAVASPLLRSSRVFAQPQPTYGAAVDGLRLGLLPLNDRGVTFVLQNVSSRELHVLSHVDAGQVNLDWFTLEMVSAARGVPARTLHFREPRTRAVPISAPVPPGVALTHDVDLRYWLDPARNAPPRGWRNAGPWTFTLRYDTRTEMGSWAGALVSAPLRAELTLR